MIKKILVAYDFSESATVALDEAIVLAHRFSASLALIHVVPFDAVSQLVNVIPHLDDVESHIRRNVEAEFSKVLGSRTSQAVAPHIRIGKPEHEIVSFAESGGYDLLLVGTHGHGGIRHFLLGSVAERVLRHARLPVLVDRPGALASSLSHILVPVDRSPASAEALRHAKTWAQAFGAKLTVMHVLGDYYYFPLYIQSDMEAYGGLVGQYEEKEKDVVRAWVREVWGSAEPEPEILFSAGVDAAHEILEIVKQKSIGLIIMGTHGRTGLEHLVLGSTAEKVVRYAPCSVMTVQGKD